MKLKTALFFSVFLFFSISCAQLDATGTMKILIHCENRTKTLTVNESSLDIVKYTVTGTGPGDKTFALDSTSASITLTGMTLGKWDISAKGLNSKGKTIASGSASFILDETGSPHTVDLSTTEGTGSLQVKYEWDTDISEPEIALKVIKSEGNTVCLEKTVTPIEGSSSCTFTLNDMPSGFYLISSILYSSGKTITGSVEAVRIANGEKTGGTLSFRSLEAYSSDLQSLYVYRRDDEPITGHLSGTKESIEAGNEITISLELDCSYSTDENCIIQWYIDGKKTGNETYLSPYDNSLTVYTDIGCHIVNAVVKNPKDSSFGSVSWKFNVKASGKEGMALFLSTIEKSDNKNLYLDSDTIISPLPDDHFLIVSPSHGTMRLCGIYNNGLTIVEKTAASDEGWTFISDIDHVYSSPYMTNFILTDTHKAINVISYDRLKGKIEKAFRGDEEARFEGSYKNFNLSFTDFNTCAFIPSSDFGGTILLNVSDDPYFLGINSNGSGVISLSGILKPEGFSSIRQLIATHSCAACISYGNTGFRIAGFSGSSRTENWQTCSCSECIAGMIRIINKNNVLIADGNSMYLFNSGKSGFWTLKNKVEMKVKLLEVSKDGKFVWIITDENALVTYTTQDNLFYKIGKIQLSKNAQSMAVSQNSILIKNNDCSISICRISEGD